jgi:hypothetical protein
MARRRDVLSVLLAAAGFGLGHGGPGRMSAAAAATGGDASASEAAAFARWHAMLPSQRQREAMFAIDAGERANWHYVPRRRRGLAFQAMDAAARTAARAAIASALSERGMAKVEDILRLEAVLGAIEARPGFRDPDDYALTVFGVPEPRGTWGWRLEGHHLSLNFAYRDGRAIGATPMFFGANPAVVPAGVEGFAHLAGLEPMAEEIGAARTLLSALDAGQVDRAVIRDRPFGDIVAGPGREQALARPEGVPAAAMSASQRQALVALIERYLGHLPAEEARARSDAIRAAGVDAIHFAWAGATEPGRGRGHYFRVHGPNVLIEYDNSRSNANHVHSVWIEPGNPFGRDVLGDHYRHGHHGTPGQAHDRAG